MASMMAITSWSMWCIACCRLCKWSGLLKPLQPTSMVSNLRCHPLCWHSPTSSWYLTVFLSVAYPTLSSQGTISYGSATCFVVALVSTTFSLINDLQNSLGALVVSPDQLLALNLVPWLPALIKGMFFLFFFIGWHCSVHFQSKWGSL